MDPLSDVLRAVRLTGAYFYTVEASAPWSVMTLPARELAPRILPASEHLISYHILRSGHCWAGLDGQPQVRMAPGDVVVFPHGDAHLMSSDRGRRVEGDEQVHSPERYPGTQVLGQGIVETTFVCGFLGCDARPFNPLLASLPACLHVPAGLGGWLADFP